MRTAMRPIGARCGYEVGFIGVAIPGWRYQQDFSRIAHPDFVGLAYETNARVLSLPQRYGPVKRRGSPMR